MEGDQPDDSSLDKHVEFPDINFDSRKTKSEKVHQRKIVSTLFRFGGVLLASSIFLTITFICGWALTSSSYAYSTSGTHGEFTPEKRDCSKSQRGNEPVCSWMGTFKADDGTVVHGVVLDEPLKSDSKGSPVSVRWEADLNRESVYIDDESGRKNFPVEIVLVWICGSALCLYLTVRSLRLKIYR